MKNKNDRKMVYALYVIVDYIMCYSLFCDSLLHKQRLRVIKMGIEETLGRLTPLTDYLHYFPPLYDISAIFPFMIYLAAYPLITNNSMEQFRKYLNTPLNEIP